MEEQDVYKLLQVLDNNREKNFVQRILYPENYPTLPIGKGKFATHLMSWGESNNKYYVFPTVIYERDKLKQYKPDAAFKRALDSGEYIEFPSSDEADQFTKQYKLIWNE